jgi:16S rRNA processing protein RimM
MTEPSPNLDELLLVGTISEPFGLRGQVKMKVVTDRLDHLARRVRTLYLGEQRRPYQLTKLASPKPGVAVLTLDGVTTREAADELRRAEVYIREHEAAPLDEDEYYIHQLYGLHVFTEDGQQLGTVREVLETGANEVLVVTRIGQSDALLPMIKDVVQELDIPGGRIVVRLLEGLLP